MTVPQRMFQLPGRLTLKCLLILVGVAWDPDGGNKSCYGSTVLSNGILDSYWCVRGDRKCACTYAHVRFQLARQRGVSLFLQTDFFSASFIYFIYLARHLRRRAPYATAIIRYAHIFYDTDNRLTKVRCYHPRHCCTVTPLQVPVVPAVSFCLLCIG